MATRVFAQSLAVGGRSFLAAISRSHSTSSSVFLRNRNLFRLRPIVATSYASYFRHISPPRGFATRATSSSLSDPNPNWSNRPPKETILLDGCDFEHWLVVMEKPEGDPTRDEIIDSYIKKLAEVVGSEEEARKKIYSVSTRHYYAFGALVSEELSYKLKELDRVRWVLPDSYLDVKNKDYGGEPFIDGQAVPYHPKYHEEWVRNNARASERNRRNDRPRQFDRSRNFERRRDPQMNQNFGGNNMTGQPNAPSPGPMQSNMPGEPSFNNNMPPPAAPNTGIMQPNYAPNMTHPSNGGNNMAGQPNAPTPGMGGQPNYNSNMAQHAPQYPGTMQPNYVPNMTPPSNTPYPGRVQNNMGGYSNSGGLPPNNTGYANGPQNGAGGGTRYAQPPVSGGFNPRGGPSQGQYQNPNGPTGNNFSQPPGYGSGQAYHAPNMQNQGHNPYQRYAPNGYQPHDQNAPPQVQNVPTRD